MLVTSLLGDGTLKFDAADGRHGHSFALCRPDSARLQALRAGTRRIDVHMLCSNTVPGPATLSAVSTADTASATLSDAASAGLHQVMLDVAQAESLLMAARRRMQFHLSAGEAPGVVMDRLSSLPPSQGRLLFPG